MRKINILLDMDGVLVDFIGGVFEVMNKVKGTNYTIEEYASEYGVWEFNKYFNVTIDELYNELNKVDRYWYNLKGFSWTKDLYEWLTTLGEVTIMTSPNRDLHCATEKMEWLKDNLSISPKEVMVGFRKNLLAGNGILIDDNIDNVESFISNGGKAILVPSTWNTTGLTFDKIKKVIEDKLNEYNGKMKEYE